MKCVRTIAPFILVLLFAAACPAAEDTDSRLDQQVTIQSLAQPLGSFVTPLSIQTGVSIKASKDVADLKIAVLAKKLPLSDLLSGLAAVLHIGLKYSKDADGKLIYEFYEEPASRKKADQQYNDARTGLRRQTDYAAEILRLNLPDEELTKKIDADEMAKPYIGDPHFRIAVEIYSRLSEKERSRLWEIGTLSMPLSSIPDEPRKKLLALFDENRKQREQADNVKLTDTVSRIAFEVQDDPLAGRALSFHIIGTGTHGMTYMFMQLPEGGTDLLGNDEFFVLKEEPETGSYFTEARQIPENLSADAGIELPEVTFMQAIQKLHEATGVSILSDWYTPRYSAQAYVDKWAMTRGDTIAHEVEKIAEVYMCKWKPLGSACLISSKTWFEDRKVEIPISTVQRWLGARQKTMRFELPELLEMSLLSDKQQRTFRNYGLSVPETFYACVRALRFCSTLTSAQRDQAASDKGLEADGLADDQKLSLLHWILSPYGMERQLSTLTEESIRGATIRIFQNDHGWVFRMQGANGQSREDLMKLE